MSRLDDVRQEVVSARRLCGVLLDHTPPEDWFRQPAGGVTHVAWQVGHIAVSQYSLGLKRLRGERPEDEALVPATFRALFARGSTPRADPAAYPPAQGIRAVFDAVHRQVLKESAEVSDATLDEPSEPPHPMFTTRLGALRWSAQHEFLHAGQIGLIRRLLGADPLF